MQFPDDENGEILTEMAEAGIDLTKTYQVDFFAAFEFEDKAAEAGKVIEQETFAGHTFTSIKVQKSEEGGGFELVASIEMPLDHKMITDIDNAYTIAVEKQKGYADGWGVEP